MSIVTHMWVLPAPAELDTIRQQFVNMRADAESGDALVRLLAGAPALIASDRSDWTAYDADLAGIEGHIDIAPQSVRDALATQIRQARAAIDARRRTIAPHLAAERREARHEADLAARCGPMPGYEMGITSGVTGYLRRSANDPDSIEVSQCTVPLLTEDHCWQSTCEFRGRNGFGALVLNTRRFDIANGQVTASSRAR